jgi:Arc/MetJ-type ribon-helix-helix transcriptional regulator
MRTIVNASMSEEMAILIKKTAKERNFKSASEYIVYAVNLEQSLISEDEILERSKEAQKSYDK